MKEIKPALTNEVLEKGRDLLILGLKVAKPDITDDQAEAIICNVGNYIQLKKLGVKL